MPRFTMPVMPVFEVRVGRVVIQRRELARHGWRLDAMALLALDSDGYARFDDPDQAFEFYCRMVAAFPDQEVTLAGSWAERSRRRRTRARAIMEDETESREVAEKEHAGLMRQLAHEAREDDILERKRARR